MHLSKGKQALKNRHKGGKIYARSRARIQRYAGKAYNDLQTEKSEPVLFGKAYWYINLKYQRFDEGGNKAIYLYVIDNL